MSNNFYIVPQPEKISWISERSNQAGNITEIVSEDYGDEGYLIRIEEDEIQIFGTKKGRFYGHKTLEQLRIQFPNQLPCIEIVDRPRFSYRGFMLDSSRHFLPKEDVLKLLDAAAYFKLNKMHWHLIDDQGFRIQIQKFPKLTEIGAKRGAVHFGRMEEPVESHDFFTQEDIRQIVAYAGERMIDVIPEIEIPGHESALLAAYPEYGCQDGIVKVQTRGGIFDHLLCVGKEETWIFITNILDELLELFPYEVIHIGGDEACKKRWRACPHCQKKMQELQLKDENVLQQWFVIKVKEYLKSKHRKALVWNDSLRGEQLDSEFMVQAWLGDKKLITDFAARGGKIVQSDVRAYYLDYPYFMSDVANILKTEPYPDYLEETLHSAIIGIEAPLWTERVPDLKTAAFQLFPRLPAVAECAWTQKDARENDSFYDRYERVSEYLEQKGLYGAPRKYWDIDEATEKEERARYSYVNDSPENLSAWKIDEALMEEERAIYGNELEEEMDFSKLLSKIKMDASICETILSEEKKLPRKAIYDIKPSLFEFESRDEGEKRLKALLGEDPKGLKMLTAMLVFAVDAYEEYQKYQIPETIYFETMKCFSRFVEEHKVSFQTPGFDRSFWTTRQISLKLFRIGELEYELDLNKGKKGISIHISSNASLKPDVLDTSFGQAREFMEQKFPEYAFGNWICSSWLLSPALENLLKEDSNILYFQKLFRIEEVEDSKDYLEWVYKLKVEENEEIDLHTLQEQTTLQKNMKEYLLAGGTIGSGFGILIMKGNN